MMAWSVWPATLSPAPAATRPSWATPPLPRHRSSNRHPAATRSTSAPRSAPANDIQGSGGSPLPGSLAFESFPGPRGALLAHLLRVGNQRSVDLHSLAILKHPLGRRRHRLAENAHGTVFHIQPRKVLGDT